MSTVNDALGHRRAGDRQGAPDLARAPDRGRVLAHQDLLDPVARLGTGPTFQVPSSVRRSAPRSYLDLLVVEEDVGQRELGRRGPSMKWM